jgi:hypothetical protein
MNGENSVKNRTNSPVASWLKADYLILLTVPIDPMFGVLQSNAHNSFNVQVPA